MSTGGGGDRSKVFLHGASAVFLEVKEAFFTNGRAVGTQKVIFCEF